MNDNTVMSGTEPLLRTTRINNELPDFRAARSPPQHAFLLNERRRHNNLSDDTAPTTEQDVDHMHGGRRTSDVNESDVLFELFQLLFGGYQSQRQQDQRQHDSQQEGIVDSVSRKSTFVWYMIPISITLGAVLGGLTVGFLSIHEMLQLTWLHKNYYCKSVSQQQQQQQQREDDGSIHLLGRGSWKWVVFTTIGGFTSGLFLLFSRIYEKKTERLPQQEHVSTNSGGFDNLCVTIFLLLSSLSALISGMPIGDEVPVGIIGSAVSFFLCRAVVSPDGNHMTYKMLMQAGVTASFVIFVPSPLLSVLLLHELSQATTSSSTLGDHQREVTATDTTTMVTSDNGPVRDNTPSRSDASEPCFSWGFRQFYMVQTLISSLATITASVVTSALVPDVYSGQSSLGAAHPLANRSGGENDGEHELENCWCWAMAAALGTVGGLVTTFVLLLSGLGRKIRIKITTYLDDRWNCPQCVTVVLFPALAGTCVGILAVWTPLTLGNEFSVFESSDIIESTPAMEWMKVAFTKCLGLAVSLGLGAFVGGPVLPMVSIGKCIGLAVSTTFSTIPDNLVVSCSVCACVGALLPAPLTIALVVAMEDDSTTSSSPISMLLISTLVGYAVTGGTGILRSCVLPGDNEPTRMRGRDQQSGNDDDTPELVEDASSISEQPPSDYDVLTTIRSAIFGEQDH